MSGVVSRDDPLREWERRQNGLAPSSAANMSSSSKKRQSANYQQLDLLQQQAELGGTWDGVSGGSRAWDPAMLGKSSASGGGAGSGSSGGGGSGTGAGSFSVVVDGSQDRTGKGSNSNSLAGLSGTGIAAPPAAYSSNSGGGVEGMGRYQTSPGLGYGLNGAPPMSASHSSGGGGSSGNVNASTLPFDIYDAGMANLLPPSLTPVRIQDRNQHLHQQQQQAQQAQQQQQQHQQQQAYLQQQQQQQQQQYVAQMQGRDKRRDGSGGFGGL
ncbi:hypothetical protein EX895_004688 [Sporisorium graminicola]|uniref:Uncharacterized protein n=1 Tax=Sporisorium graminicola TaxID=280036 RepID=A0A4V6ETG5_9BASI|nr:hypothetical protein EX895_004688 [Sporisorium graminicola]TKY86539.1 hypothetical protein EX895_004688 [Sporisorium graminicola]